MTYKGYIAKIENDDPEMFSGYVINTRAVITFHGTSLDEITKEFHKSVDDYIDWCKEEGIRPESNDKEIIL